MSYCLQSIVVQSKVANTGKRISVYFSPLKHLVNVWNYPEENKISVFITEDILEKMTYFL